MLGKQESNYPHCRESVVGDTGRPMHTFIFVQICAFRAVDILIDWQLILQLLPSCREGGERESCIGERNCLQSLVSKFVTRGTIFHHKCTYKF